MVRSSAARTLVVVCTSLLLTVAARPLGDPDLVADAKDFVNADARSRNSQDVLGPLLENGLGLATRLFPVVNSLSAESGFLIGQEVGGGEQLSKTTHLHRTDTGDDILVSGLSARVLLQAAGTSQQPGNAYPGYQYGGVLVSPFISIVMGAAICVGLCVFLSVCRVVVRHRFAQPLQFEATARQEAPSAALPHSILKSLPIVSFKKEGENQTFNQGSGENQCPICLIEFEPKDSLRKLPECSHYFHQGCVDEWFKRNHTCPLCRTSLLPAEQSSAAAGTANNETLHVPIGTEAHLADETVVRVAALEQEAEQAVPRPLPLEREGPGVSVRV